MGNKNVISFMNMKGGVGKTTLCVNLADCLARHFDKKVLLIDLDPQFNATQYLINQKTYIDEIYKKELTINKIFMEGQVKPSLLNGVIHEEKPDTSNLEYMIYENLYIVPGDLTLVNLEKNSSSTKEHKLKKYIQSNKLNEKYDFIFIDCPPTQSIYTLAAFYASDYYIMPVKPDFLSTLGINLFRKTIEDYNDVLPHKLECLGIIFTLVQDHTNHCRETMRDIKQRYKFYTFNNYLKHSIQVPENAEKNVCLLDLQDFKSAIINIAKEFLEAYPE
jgi:chromosome partitioning protein